MNDPINELEPLLTRLAEHAPHGVSRASVARRVTERRRRRAAARIGGGVACVAAVTAGIVTVRGRSHEGNGDAVGPSSTISNVTIVGQTTTQSSFPVADPQAQNFLITGADSNACVDPNSPWADATDPTREDFVSRSDTIMVMRVDPVTRAAAVLSFPRDLWVDIPGKGKNRINSAYVQNDYSLLAQTIYNNFGIIIDHYIQVDFCAFKGIVDALGGVAVPFTTAIIDRNVGLYIAPPAGQTGTYCHTFSGDEALAYVRSRHLEWIDEQGTTHADPAADLGRISRQQDFLRRTLGQAVKAGMFDPSVARALLESLQTEIVTEQGFTLDDMLSVVGVLKDVDPVDIQQYQIEATATLVSGNFVLAPQTDSPNMQAVLAIFSGTAPLSGSSDQPIATTAPSSNTAVTALAEPQQVIKGDIVPDPNVEC
jgi:LCP family protein required for cell wall assembly